MLILKDIVKDYPLGSNEKLRALKSINVCFEKTGFVSILGASGCGKTTLLNIIGGLDHYTEGDLIIDGISTSDYKDKDRDFYRNNKIGFVFQSYNLIPHLSILENVMIPLSLNGENASSRKEKALKALEKVGLKEVYKKKPNQLSGGQMQRVAIARSLVNDPEIILADEPTGALDSKTSVVVMDILKEISKTKLVIMVTHNEKLANHYSTRIISMFDGQIVNDTAPIEAENESSNKEIRGKTSMNFINALKMAGKNILTKKGRVAMISVASSFGVIGVGLVLALSNGFEGYISRVEQATAAQAPITVSSTAINYVINEDKVDYEKFPEDEEVKIYEEKDNATLVQQIHYNDLSDDFIEYIEKINDHPEYKNSVASFLVNYTSPQYALVSKQWDADKYTFFNSNQSISSTLSSLAGFTNLPNSIFHELYGGKEYIEQTYDVIAGTYPQEEWYIKDGERTFDIVLIVDQYNRIDKSTLVNLGLLDSESTEKSVGFAEILNTKFKFYTNDEIYYFNENNPDDAYDTAVYKMIPEKEITVKDDKGTERKINFPEHQGVQYLDYSKDQSALKDLYDNTFEYKKDNLDYVAQGFTLNVSGIIRVNKDALLDYMPMSFAYTQGFKNYAISRNKHSQISQLTLGNFDLQPEAITKFQTYLEDLQLENPTVNPQDLVNKYNDCFKTYGPFVGMKRNSDGTITGNFATNIIYTNYKYFLQRAYGYGGDLLLSKELQDLIDSITEENMVSKGLELYDYFKENPKEFNEAIHVMGAKINSTSLRESIVIFANSLNDKEKIKAYIDERNLGKVDSEQIQYTDIIGTLTDGLGQMINIISVVLVVFASISLVVSCVMTGIITYNSVLERIKEIGVLRAVGARKKDVGRLFKMESLIIGAVSGIIGVAFTLIVSIPINAILNAIYPEYNIGSIASLDLISAIVLIIISGALAFVSGIIPARNAARKDPVIALRSE